ncbi:MAG TPA: MarR family transcriptional regulator, partial [Burkholderiaceae bacterium]
MNIPSPPSSTVVEPAPGMRLLIEDSLGYQLRMLLGSLRQQADDELDACGLTSAQWIPLIKLYMGEAS